MIKLVNLQEIIKAIESFAPTYLAGSWDNVGLILGNRNKTIHKALLTLDVDLDVAKEAVSCGADVIISHHPFIFHPLKQINSDSRLGDCIMLLLKHDIAVYSAHTNLDATQGGLNDYLVDLYELTNPIITDIVYNDQQGKSYGLGRVGTLPQPMTLAALSQYIAKKLGVKSITYTGDPNAMIQKTALCSGGGGSRISFELASMADVYITGDVKYSNAREAADLGLNIIVAEHYDTEIFCIGIFEKLLSAFDIEINKTQTNKNIFKSILCDGM